MQELDRGKLKKKKNEKVQEKGLACMEIQH